MECQRHLIGKVDAALLTYIKETENAMRYSRNRNQSY